MNEFDRNFLASRTARSGGSLDGLIQLSQWDRPSQPLPAASSQFQQLADYGRNFNAQAGEFDRNFLASRTARSGGSLDGIIQLSQWDRPSQPLPATSIKEVVNNAATISFAGGVAVMGKALAHTAASNVPAYFASTAGKLASTAIKVGAGGMAGGVLDDILFPDEAGGIDDESLAKAKR